MELTKEELAFYTGLLQYKPLMHNGYWWFRPRNRIYGSKRYKRSRVLMQLKLNRKLSVHEKIRFRDGNTANDSISNLYLE